jgi:hypothetical protein
MMMHAVGQLGQTGYDGRNMHVAHTHPIPAAYCVAPPPPPHTHNVYGSHAQQIVPGGVSRSPPKVDNVYNMPMLQKGCT